MSHITQRSKVTLRAHLSCHRSYSQQDPPVAEEHEKQRQEQAEDEQTADVGASCGRALLPLDGAGGAGTLRPVAAHNICSDFNIMKLVLCHDVFNISLLLVLLLHRVYKSLRSLQHAILSSTRKS